MKIENEFLRVEAKAEGGSLTSLFDKRRDTELLYQPLPYSWQGQDVFIFPFIARLKDSTYEYEGKTYNFKNHGLLRYMTAEENRISPDTMSYTFRSDKETILRYPFDFEAVITYTVKGKELIVSYTINNLSDKDMPFMSGSHPAFMLPGKTGEDIEFDMSGNFIEFDTDGDLTVLLQEETFSFMTGEATTLPSRIELSKELFGRINTIIIKSENIRNVRLVKSDSSTLTMDKGDAPFIALWSDKKTGNYVCIEPWFGVPDYLDNPKDIMRKKEIRVLKPGLSFKFSYKLLVD